MFSYKLTSNEFKQITLRFDYGIFKQHLRIDEPEYFFVGVDRQIEIFNTNKTFEFCPLTCDGEIYLIFNGEKTIIILK